MLPLVVVGLPADARAATEASVLERGLGDVVTVRPWLSTEEFQRTFTSASLVVFPSDFEGFGLPALEAMRLGIPVVVTPDTALLEVTGDMATVMDGWDAPSAGQGGAAGASADRRAPQSRGGACLRLHLATHRVGGPGDAVRLSELSQNGAAGRQALRRAKTTRPICMLAGKWRSTAATTRRKRGQGLKYCSRPVRWASAH